MKTPTFLFLLTLCSPVWAAPASAPLDPCASAWHPQSSAALTQLLGFEGYSLGSDTESRIARSLEVIALAESVAAERGIAVKRVDLKTHDGQGYVGLQVVPHPGSPAGREAARVEKDFFGLPLVFSPYDLALGSKAFFKPDGTLLGIPYRFWSENPAVESSYRHELEHAEDYRRILSGETPPWSGLMRVREGTYLSPENMNAYFRFSALNEILTTTLSLQMNAERLLQMSANQEAEALLSEIYHDTISLQDQAEQLADLTTRALKEELPPLQSTTLKLGHQERPIWQSVFAVDAYVNEIVRSRGTILPVADGAEFTLNWSQPPTADQIRDRLQNLRSAALETIPHAKDLRATIQFDIERARLRGSNLPALRIRAQALKDWLWTVR